MASRRQFLITPAAGALAGAQTQRSKDRIGVGLIGCGNRGSHLARVLTGLRGPASIVAVCDVYQPRLNTAAKAFSARSYRDSAELLRDPAVDAVIVATPDRVHVYKALEAVRAGKDIYCEKPLTHWTQFDRLKELLREAAERRTVFQVGAQWVSEPTWLRAAALVKQGAIGNPVHAQCGYFRRGDSGERGMRIDDPNARPGPDLNWDAFQADAPQREFTASRFFQWRLYMDYSGGPSTDLYPHAMTRLFKVLNPGLPKKVVAVGGKYVYDGGRDVPDTFDLLIGYDKLTVAVLGTIANETGIDTVIRGTEGTLTFPPGGLVVEGKQRFSTNLTPYEQEHMRNWIDCIRTRQKPNAGLELSYQVQVPLIMAMRSFVEGKVVFFDAATQTIRL